MPILSTVNGSFFAGRRSNAFSTYNPSVDIPNLSLWLDPSDTSTTSYSGSNLTAITDKTSTATMTVNNTPVKITVNSLEALQFVQSSNEYLQSDTTAQVDGGNHWALFIGQIEAPDNNKDSIWAFETDQSPKRDYAVSSGDASDFDGELDLDGLSSNRISSTAGNLISFTAQTPIATSTDVIVVAFFNQTGNQIGVRVNGTNAFTPETDYDNNVKDNQQLRIFRNRGSQTFGGSLYEFLSVKGLPGTGGTDMTYIEQAEGYVAHKWGAASVLPVSHPYKSSAP